MTLKQKITARWVAAKPMIMGLAIGLLVGPFFSNYMGWQVTGGSAHAQLQAAVVEAKAMVCNARARADVADPSKLDWSGRNDLAKKWAVMPGGTAADPDVTYACSSKLAG